MDFMFDTRRDASLARQAVLSRYARNAPRKLAYLLGAPQHQETTTLVLRIVEYALTGFSSLEQAPREG